MRRGLAVVPPMGRRPRKALRKSRRGRSPPPGNPGCRPRAPLRRDLPGLFWTAKLLVTPRFDTCTCTRCKCDAGRGPYRSGTRVAPVAPGRAGDGPCRPPRAVRARPAPTTGLACRSLAQPASARGESQVRHCPATLNAPNGCPKPLNTLRLLSLPGHLVYHRLVPSHRP